MELETYTQVKTSIRSLLKINLDHYKDEQMRRRLDSWLIRSGAPDWNEYFKRLRSEPSELGRFRDYLTINVSAFFRDQERWTALRENILPELLASPNGLGSPARVKASGQGALLQQGLNVWSAGCSIGAEPYTLAMVLDEVAPARRHQILATDLDRGALTKARSCGPYTQDEIQNLSASQRARFLEPGGPPFYLKSSLAKKIEFREHDMIANPFPSDFDLIVCRNVVIYFTSETKDRLYQKFYQALRPGGILFVGATEIIPRPQDIGFQSHGISFYRKG